MRIDRVARVWDAVTLRALGRSGIEERDHRGGLIRGKGTLPAAEDEVVFAIHDVNGPGEQGGWRYDVAEREELAERVGGLVADLVVEHWYQKGGEVSE